MSKISSVNNDIVTGAEAILIFKTTLKTAGWTIPRSSDGLTYNSSGDQITHGSSGAEGMANNRAWFVIQSPNGEHQWCFQRGTSNRIWRVKISSLDGFTGGTPSATQVPSATDEQVLLGSGTDASPTMTNLFPLDDTYRFHVIGENAAVGTVVPIYGFWSFTTGIDGVPNTFISQEPMDPDTFPELSSGTRASPVVGDPDPCIYICKYISNDTNFLIDTWQALTVVKAWYKMNYSGSESFEFQESTEYKSAYQGAPNTQSQGYAQNPYTNEDDGLPVLIGRGSPLANQGLKGVCKFLRLKIMDRNYPNVFNLTGDSMVCVGDLLIPWEDNTLPLV